jgi:hypothetical protein
MPLEHGSRHRGAKISVLRWSGILKRKAQNGSRAKLSSIGGMIQSSSIGDDRDIIGISSRPNPRRGPERMKGVIKSETPL